ncbi:MAG: hypothetical protein M3Y35_18025 [Actinomycetota bacterium]|nr:hypothetical protein [Actinomycetota bacterium]
MALAGHRDAGIRKDLAKEGGQSEDVLTLLASDLDPLVADAARWQLDHRLHRVGPALAGGWSDDELADESDVREDPDWTPSWGAE